MSRQDGKAPMSVLDNLKGSGVVDKSLSLDEAVGDLTDELNCVECIAVDECADCYGMNTKDNRNPRCKEVVKAYLSQDYIKRDKEDK